MTPNRLCLLLCIVFFSAQAASALTLAEAYQLALLHSSEWLTAKAKHAQSREYLPQAYSQLKPSININLTGSRVSQILTTGSNSSPMQQYPSNTGSISIRQPLLIKRQLALVDQASARQAQADQVLNYERQQLGLRVASSYFNWLIAIEESEALQRQKTAAEMSLHAAERSFEERIGTALDVSRAKTKLAEVNATIIKNQVELRIAKATLENVTGVTSGKPIRPPEAELTKIISSINSRFTGIEPIIESNPNVLASKEQLKVAEMTLKAVRYGQLPEVDLIAQYSSSTGENAYFSQTSGRATSIGIRINFALYSGGFITSSVRQAAAELEEAVQKYSLVRKEVAIQYKTISGNLEVGLRVLDAARGVRDSAEQQLRASQIARKHGQATDIDIFNSSAQVSKAKSDTLRAELEVLRNWFELIALKGHLYQDAFIEMGSL